jgi:hypothetical protein
MKWDRQTQKLRGGSWNNNPQNCRSACRNNNNNPDNNNNNVGFRVVCEAASTLPIVRADKFKDLSGVHEESRPVPVAQKTVPENNPELGSLVARANSCPIHLSIDKSRN